MTAPKPPFGKILIANRGEIALRVIRACRELGVKTVAVYSQCDANALHVRFADEAVCIGPPAARQSYLNIPRVLSAAEITGADAVHPGYGFLAENADFARAVTEMGMTFIGPDTKNLRVFGDKLSAKDAARAAGLPLLEGSPGPVATMDEAVTIARKVGYPIILKAAAGGGGKGMRVVEDDDQLRRIFELTRTEALASFGNGDVFIERYLREPRHIEVQVAGDKHGAAIHVGERDCSMQRRHQKIVEEAPAPGLSESLRGRIREAAAKLVASTGYHTVGTCEFLVEGEEFFFLEVNPRIQVEHCVTEEVSGIDLIQLQIRLAAGEPMPLRQEDVRLDGHAIEARVNAEDPWRFTPCPGQITGYHAPGGLGIRIDSAVCEGAWIQPYYDSMVAKIIAWGPTREIALSRLVRAMDEAVVEGVKTTLPLHRELLRCEEFATGRFSTKTLEVWLARRAADGSTSG